MEMMVESPDQECKTEVINMMRNQKGRETIKSGVSLDQRARNSDKIHKKCWKAKAL